jgi:protein-tyrosine sulfotransferase
VSLAAKARNRIYRVTSHRWRMRPDTSPDDAIVIGGSSRSGTTLVRKLLDQHQDIMCGPETNLLLPAAPNPEGLALDYGLDAGEIRAWRRDAPSQVRFVETFMHAALGKREKRRWGEKTPLNVSHLDWILSRFPNARFVHVIRDGRDAVCSMRSHGTRRLVDGRWVKQPRTRTVEECASSWRNRVEEGIRHRGNPRYHELRYENLVRLPDDNVAELFGFVGEQPVGVGDLQISDASLGRWRGDLTADEQATVRRICGPLLDQLGYTAADPW